MATSPLLETSPTSGSTARAMLNKVPEVTLYFWVIKILATTVGETFADYLNSTIGIGLTGTTLIMAGFLVVSLVFQFRLRLYVPFVYWLSVVLISVVGTLFSDNLVDNYGIGLPTTTVGFAIILAIVFAVWYRSEGTLSIHSIVTTRREAFYWLAVLFTFALGTSAGDLVAERLAVGYWQSALLFAALIAATFIAHRRFGVERDPDVLDRLHPDAPARSIDRRLPVTADRRWWPRARYDRDERDLPRSHPRRRHLPHDHEGRPHRGCRSRSAAGRTPARTPAHAASAHAASAHAAPAHAAPAGREPGDRG